MKIDQEQYDIFKRGSTTYFNSSRFFPARIRPDVFRLYAFVRSADDYVDCIPQDARGFLDFKADYEQAWAGRPAARAIVRDFVEMARRRRFEPAWTAAFLHSMQLDLSKKLYRTIEETLEYVYGSAEVVGLYMARILELPAEADEPARLLGRAMQFINFIRDLAEDGRLGRTYLPVGETSLPDLREASARRDPSEFARFISAQAERYRDWQKRAESGYRYLPRRVLVPIRTAADMYMWTSRKIERDPYAVYGRKIKPSALRILAGGLLNAIRPRF